MYVFSSQQIYRELLLLLFLLPWFKNLMSSMSGEISHCGSHADANNISLSTSECVAPLIRVPTGINVDNFHGHEQSWGYLSFFAYTEQGYEPTNSCLYFIGCNIFNGYWNIILFKIFRIDGNLRTCGVSGRYKKWTSGSVTTADCNREWLDGTNWENYLYGVSSACIKIRKGRNIGNMNLI